MELRGDIHKNRIFVSGLECEELSEDQWRILNEHTLKLQERLKIAVWVRGFHINGTRPTSEEPIFPEKKIENRI